MPTFRQSSEDSSGKGCYSWEYCASGFRKICCRFRALQDLATCPCSTAGPLLQPGGPKSRKRMFDNPQKLKTQESTTTSSTPNARLGFLFECPKTDAKDPRALPDSGNLEAFNGVRL